MVKPLPHTQEFHYPSDRQLRAGIAEKLRTAKTGKAELATLRPSQDQDRVEHPGAREIAVDLLKAGLRGVPYGIAGGALFGLLGLLSSGVVAAAASAAVPMSMMSLAEVGFWSEVGAVVGVIVGAGNRSDHWRGRAQSD